MAYRGHSGPVWDVTYAPLAPYFATASHDRTARLWSVEHAAPLRILAGHLADVDAVCFHKNSHYLATGSVDKSLRMWDVRAGPCVRVLSAHTGPVHALAFSPCGQFISSAGGGTHTIAWRLPASLPSQMLTACGCAGADGTIIVWDVAAGQIAARLKCADEKDKQALGDHVWSLDYSACGKLLSAAHRYAHPPIPTQPSSLTSWSHCWLTYAAAVFVAGCSGGAVTLWDVEMEKAAPAGTKADAAESGGWRHLKSFMTRRTTVCTVKFTHRNLLQCGGGTAPPLACHGRTRLEHERKTAPAPRGHGIALEYSRMYR